MPLPFGLPDAMLLSSSTFRREVRRCFSHLAIVTLFRAWTMEPHRRTSLRSATPRSYRTIIVPSSSFQLITDPHDAAEAMRRFLRHLEPGGTLVLPFMIPWDGPATESIVAVDWELVAEQVRPEDGLLIRRWARATYDLAQQLEHTEDRYEVIHEGEIIASEQHSRSPAGRWYTSAQAIKLYEEAGFTTIRILKGFTQEPASASDSVAKDTVFSVLGERP